MSGIIRWSEGGIRPLATLKENGWVCTHNQLPYRAVYERGEEVIELERDGAAFYSLGDRRITNGTWETIVERFALAKEEKRDSHDEIASVEECIAQLEATHGTDRDPVASAVYYLKMYAASLANGKERNG